MLLTLPLSATYGCDEASVVPPPTPETPTGFIRVAIQVRGTPADSAATFATEDWFLEIGHSGVPGSVVGFSRILEVTGEQQRLELRRFAPNCSVPDNPRSVTVPAGDTSYKILSIS